MTRRGWALVVGAVVVGLAGCGGGPPTGPKLGKVVPVSGRVLLPDGTPVRGGIVIFTPLELEVPGGGGLRYEGAGTIDAKGQYKAGLNGDGSGLVVGEYKVTVKGREMSELKDANVARIPKVYTDAGTTSLKVTVDENTSTLDIPLK